MINKIYENQDISINRDRISIISTNEESISVPLHLSSTREILGLVSCDNNRVNFDKVDLKGTDLIVNVIFNLVGLEKAEKLEGNIYLTTNGGEFEIPYCITTKDNHEEQGIIPCESLDDFVKICRNSFNTGFKVFKSKAFESLISRYDNSTVSLYKGLSKNPVTMQNIEEFMVTISKKDKVDIETEEKELIFQNLKESIQKEIIIKRSNWGHTKIDVLKDGDFIIIDKKVITEDDFIGNQYSLEFVIDRDKLFKGNGIGNIILKTPYKTIYVKIIVKAQNNKNHMDYIARKRYITLINKELIYFFNKKTKAEELYKNTKNIFIGIKEQNLTSITFTVLQALIFYLSNRKDEAKKIILKNKDYNFTKSNIGEASIYLFLCYNLGIITSQEKVVLKLKSFENQFPEIYLISILKDLVETKEKLATHENVYNWENLYNRGCRSPYLYIIALNELNKNSDLLIRINDFWTSVVLYGIRNSIITKEILDKYTYLVRYNKDFSLKIYFVLSSYYEINPTNEVLKELISLLIKGDPLNKSYFKWYKLAVQKGIRITRIYEYYMETIDKESFIELPRNLLLYFGYSDTGISQEVKGYLYSCIITFKENIPEIYNISRERILDYAKDRLNNNINNMFLSRIYEEFFEELLCQETRSNLLKHLFDYKITVDNKDIHKVIVSNNKIHNVYEGNLNYGAGICPIYAKNSVILLEDKYQRRFVSTAEYKLEKLMDYRRLIRKINNVSSLSMEILVYITQREEINEGNIRFYIDLYNLNELSKSYKEIIGRKIIQFFKNNSTSKNMGYIRNFNTEDLLINDRRQFIKELIANSLVKEAYNLINNYGYEALDKNELLKVANYGIESHKDSKICVYLALKAFLEGAYNETTLEYLSFRLNSNIDYLIMLWEKLKKFGMDSYLLEQKILKLLLLTKDTRKKGEEVLYSYYKNFGNTSLIYEYLKIISYGHLILKYPIKASTVMIMEKEYLHRNKISELLAYSLLRALSKYKVLTLKQKEILDELLSFATSHNKIFDFYSKISKKTLEKYYINDKAFISYYGNEDDKVVCAYSINSDVSGGEYEFIQLENTYKGIFSKSFTLFYGEKLHYFFIVNGKETKEKTISLNKLTLDKSSKYNYINYLLRLKESDCEDFNKELLKFSKKEEYIKNIFRI